jgi:chromosome segregation ATPase
MSPSDVAKQLEERDADYKAVITKLKGQVAELLDEKEQRKGQLKKTKELLVTSEIEVSQTKTKLLALKEQATRWEVEIARLNVDLASKSSTILLT